MRDTAPVRGHLPEENPGFVGRRTELKRMSAALAEHRLVTVTGTGGVGKTRLALRAAHHVRRRHPDGAWWTDLGQLDGERLLVALVSDAVDLADHTPGTDTTALRRRLAGTRLLLVLDCCDHVADACGRLVTDLLAAAPGLTVLATSRRPLGVPGEHTVLLDPLPPTGGDALDLLRTAAGEDLPATGPAAEICVRLEGIPLALELAAAQIRLQGAPAVRDQLGHRLDARPGARLDLLAHPERVWPARHQTLRAAIGWSHELAGPLERLLWARLSVFRGPFDLASVTAVCAGGPLTETALPAALDGLVRASVVRPADPAGRHRMLDTLREYGADWLDRLGETAAVADRHAAHFGALARLGETAWHGPGQLAWYRAVDTHHTDLRTALDRLLRTDPDAALDLVGSVAFAWSCRGRLREARDGLEQALLLSEARGRARTRALWALGVTLALQGDLGPAQDVSERCAREARHTEHPLRAADAGPEPYRPGDLTLDAAALAGLLALTTGRARTALVVVDHVLASARGGPADSAAALRCRLVRVFALTGLGLLADARADALALRAHCERLDEHWTRTALEYQLALTGLLEGDPAAAAAHARAMLAGTRALGASLGVALGLDVLATAHAAAGDGERAADVSGTGEAYWRVTGQPRRGLPGLRTLHAHHTAAVRAALGDPVYEEIFLRSLTDLPQAGLDRALGTGGREPSGGAP
ncbi:ATP-binding protein [Streptomyces filamentosus]|uniref:ATP-binding protein n=1 Tax=Streptomyces filamentosus TaxID=67294 RepID=UPI00123984CF|nr:NB-ARC domain-containing protein [Streptomyces filamentosus]KAA6210688.1 regulator [Streptomyces filamentosus]